MNGHNSDCPCIECTTNRGNVSTSSGVGIQINDPGVIGTVKPAWAGRDPSDPSDPRFMEAIDMESMGQRLDAMESRVDKCEVIGTKRDQVIADLQAEVTKMRTEVDYMRRTGMFVEVVGVDVPPVSVPPVSDGETPH